MIYSPYISAGMQTVTDVVDLIENKLGGPEKAAEIFGEREGTVHIWKHRRKLPARLFVKHLEILKRHEISAPPSLWGLES